MAQGGQESQGDQGSSTPKRLEKGGAFVVSCFSAPNQIPQTTTYGIVLSWTSEQQSMCATPGTDFITLSLPPKTTFCMGQHSHPD
jgi:hypothetical protein